MASEEILANILDAVPLLLTTAVARRTDYGMAIEFRGKTYDFRGPQVFEVLQTIAPRMSGSRRLQEIGADLAPLQRKVALSLVRHLLEKGIAVDCAREAAAESEAGLQEFHGQLLFARHFVPEATQRFLRWRHSRVLLAGDADTCAALAVSLLRNGIEKVFVEESLWNDKASQCTLLEECELGSVTPRLEGFGSSDLMSKGAPRFAAVCYAAAEPELGVARELSGLCRGHDVPFVPGVFLGGKAFVGPVVVGRKSACWMCFLQRYIDNAPPAEQASLWKRLLMGALFDDTQSTSNPVARRILANSMGIEVFKMLMGYGRRELLGQVLAMDWGSLKTALVHVLPHPSCPVCSNITAKADRDGLMQAIATVKADTSRASRRAERLWPLVDSIAGVATKFNDGALVQTPLFRTVLVAGPEEHTPSNSFSGSSLDSNADARIAAMREFARAYATKFADKRRMVCSELHAAELQGIRRIKAVDLSDWLGGDPVSGSSRYLMYAGSRRDSALYLVPAGAVYPAVARATGEFSDASVGVGVGFSFNEACEDAEKRLVAHELLKGISRGDESFVSLSLTSAREISRDIHYLVDALNRLGHAPNLIGSEWFSEGGCMLAFSNAMPRTQSCVTVGYGGSRLHAAVVALRELLAVLSGGSSACTLEKYLPARLGYRLSLCEEDRQSVVGEVIQSTVEWEMSVQEPHRFQNVLFANLTTPDLESAGLAVVRALAVTAPR